jgi:EAL domain-containing protein (putative c-di-GMP-specific phosphodiesterase class I)/CHASE2 domain-containing sensor protein
MIRSLLNRAGLRPVLILALGLCLGLMAAVTEAGPALDRALDPVRFGLAGRPASGRIAIVEMDAASVAAIKAWPWPRGHYAQVIDRLRAAGAASVAFDVDLSSPSVKAEDDALAAALARAGGAVALPTFAQKAGSTEARMLDTVPLPEFRAHATLASVIMVPDSDGVVRYAPAGTITRGTPRPSLSAFLARQSGSADEFYPIDYGIDPNSIPRLSFVAVRDGRFDPGQVRGRDVVIGATAIEMGDRYATPRWGVLPGVVIQALGAETLLRGMPVETSPLLGLGLALLLATAIVFPRSHQMAGVAGGAALTFYAGFCVWAQDGPRLWLPMSAGLVLLLSVCLCRAVVEVAERFQAQRLRDEATGLPNRRALLGEAAPAGMALAVATIVNRDQLAAVLSGEGERQLALRIVERLRIPAAGEQVWRLSDRQLAFFLAEDEVDQLEALRLVMLRPIEVAGRQVDVTLAVGLTTVQADVEQAIAEATLASDRAIEEGVFWTRAGEDVAAAEQAVTLMGELDAAIAAGQILVHYQPKLAIAEDWIRSAEALVRWRHPERGWISPDRFIPLAEQGGRIEALTLHVLRTVLADLARWRAAGLELTVAINISAKLLTSASFNAAMRAVIERTDVPSSALIYEVTESAAIADPDAAVSALQSYRALGIAISMDDYGTGQSTLSYFRRLPLSEVKIDRSFVQNAHVERSDGVLVRSTVALAHELGLKIVAEGVEEPECLAFLAAIGCDYAQGYLIGKPMPAEAFAETLTAHSRKAA